MIWFDRASYFFPGFVDSDLLAEKSQNTEPQNLTSSVMCNVFWAISDSSPDAHVIEWYTEQARV